MLYRVVLCCPRLFYNWFQKSTWDTKFFRSDIRTMEKALYKGEYVSALFMDLPKAFDTISDDLLIAKLKAYGFSGEVLKLMKSHLKN